MKAIIVKEPGGAEQLQLVDGYDKPTIKDGELLIKVQASAINRTDILHRQSEIGYMTNPVLGVEVAGVVEEVGAGTSIPVGTKVAGLVNGGGYAEYAVMQEANAIFIPESLSFEEAVAIPEVFLTAYQTLFWIGKLQEGETVLIHAGASGVGTAAIQLAKSMANANVIVTAGSDEKLAFCRSLGADVCINYKKEVFEEEVLKATDQQGVDLILDFVGASYWEKNLKSIKVDGRWVLIGILGGSKLEQMNLMDFMLKRVQLTGTLLTPRSDAYKAALTKEFTEKAMHLFEQKTIRPIVDHVYPIEDIRYAHERMENNENIGKIVLSLKN